MSVLFRPHVCRSVLTCQHVTAPHCPTKLLTFYLEPSVGLRVGRLQQEGQKLYLRHVLQPSESLLAADPLESPKQVLIDNSFQKMATTSSPTRQSCCKQGFLSLSLLAGTSRRGVWRGRGASAPPAEKVFCSISEMLFEVSPFWLWGIFVYLGTHKDPEGR